MSRSENITRFKVALISRGLSKDATFSIPSLHIEKALHSSNWWILLDEDHLHMPHRDLPVPLINNRYKLRKALIPLAVIGPATPK